MYKRFHELASHPLTFDTRMSHRHVADVNMKVETNMNSAYNPNSSNIRMRLQLCATPATVDTFRTSVKRHVIFISSRRWKLD